MFESYSDIYFAALVVTFIAVIIASIVDLLNVKVSKLDYHSKGIVYKQNDDGTVDFHHLALGQPVGELLTLPHVSLMNGVFLEKSVPLVLSGTTIVIYLDTSKNEKYWEVSREHLNLN